MSVTCQGRIEAKLYALLRVITGSVSIHNPDDGIITYQMLLHCRAKLCKDLIAPDAFSRPALCRPIRQSYKIATVILNSCHESCHHSGTTSTRAGCTALHPLVYCKAGGLHPFIRRHSERQLINAMIAK